MGTLAARLGLTKAPLSVASLGIPEYRKLLLRRMERLAKAGADGLHIDKCSPFMLNFNPRLTASPDRVEWEAHLLFLDELFDRCRAINPEFQISYESWWDRLMPYSDVCWWAPDSHSVMKVVFPHWVSHAGIVQPYDYNMVNLATVRGQNLLVGPANYTDSMRYAPMKDLCAYVGEVTRIRNELLDFVSRGELVDASEPLFASRQPVLRLSGPSAKDTNLRWSVFRNAVTGVRTAVLANLGRTPMRGLSVSFTGEGRGRCQVHRPFRKPASAALPVVIGIPPERLAIVVESEVEKGLRRRPASTTSAIA